MSRLNPPFSAGRLCAICRFLKYVFTSAIYHGSMIK
ncbi:hypothetical protein BACCAP_00236 [Pseudoflavonifractor capillosus ATCC 29799]|uniref:Uncharacterized protein n=1 Tax=Pseudoflavonifractor capillosus ATCC 29799 TaxID=411467 RepID=A6NPW9_9FIRM|nr:hypothetical protein BACCAP_00236 [Pseudoflavonifractor capillosus ATCC 29799]